MNYAGWIYHLRHGEPPTDRAIGEAVGRTGQAVSAWWTADAANMHFSLHVPLAGFLGVDKDWLIEGKGAPPLPDLWPLWVRYQRARPKGRANVVGPFKPALPAKRTGTK